MLTFAIGCFAVCCRFRTISIASFCYKMYVCIHLQAKKLSLRVLVFRIPRHIYSIYIYIYIYIYIKPMLLLTTNQTLTMEVKDTIVNRNIKPLSQYYAQLLIHSIHSTITCCLFKKIILGSGTDIISLLKYLSCWSTAG